MLTYLLVLSITLLPWALWRLSKPVDVRLRGAARYRGLQVKRGVLYDTAEGTIDSFGVHVRYIDTQRPRKRDQPWGPPSANCRVAVNLPTPLPSGLHLSSMSLTQHIIQALGGQDIEIGDDWLDSALRIYAERPAEARRILADPTVRSTLRRVAINTREHLKVTPDQITLVRSGVNVPDAGELIDLALDIAHTLQSASGLVWEDLAAQLGLLEVTTSRSSVVMSGVIEGVPVRLSVQTDEDGESTTRLHASFDAMLPGALRLRSRRPEAATASTGNPILDMHVEMHATDEAQARALLADPSITGPLLELLSEAPDARILPDGIKLSMSGWTFDTIAERLSLITELAGCFNAAAAHSGPVSSDTRPVRQGLPVKG